MYRSVLENKDFIRWSHESVALLVAHNEIGHEEKREKDSYGKDVKRCEAKGTELVGPEDLELGVWFWRLKGAAAGTFGTYLGWALAWESSSSLVASCMAASTAAHE